MIDLIELNESKYIEVSYQTGYVFIGYNPSNHLMFLRFSKTKQSEVMTEYLKEMIAYLDKNKNRIENVQFTEVVMDEGTEFKGEFTELLDEEKIKIRRVDPHKEDHRQLAPLNAMCKFVRDQIFKRFIAMDKQDQNGEVPLKIMVTSASINKIVKEVMEFHNFSRKIKPYNKTPAEVTVDDIEQFNQMKSELNQDVENKYKFDIEDVVKIILKKKDLLKSRHQKYSDGNYKVIGRDGQHYTVVPMNFDLKKYTNYFQLQDKGVVGVPVVYRKSYEIKPCSDNNKNYFPAENDEAKHYVFEEIVKSSVDKFEKINK